MVRARLDINVLDTASGQRPPQRSSCHAAPHLAAARPASLDGVGTVRLSQVCDTGGDTPVVLTELPKKSPEDASRTWLALGTTAQLVEYVAGPGAVPAMSAGRLRVRPAGIK